MDYRITIVSVGGGGTRIVDRMSRNTVEEVTIVAADVDAKSLAAARGPVKIQFGSGRTDGHGAGGDRNLGKLAAEDEIEKIRSTLAGTKLLMLVTCLGGGTGTGAAPVILNAAREAGALSLCFAVTPFGIEGDQRRATAEHAIPVLKECSDSLIVLHNDRLGESTGQTSMTEIFNKSNQMLSDGINAILKLLTERGLIHLDFADLRTMVRNSGGICTFGYGDGTGKNKAQSAAKALLNSPLLRNGEVIAESRSMLMSIVGGPDLTIKDVEEIKTTVSGRARKDNKLFMGTVVDEKWENRVSVTVIVSEEWIPATVDSPVSQEATEQPSKPGQRTRSKGKKQGLEQPDLPMMTDKGRFKDVDPTIMDGENLDIPTFIRRNIAIER